MAEGARKFEIDKFVGDITTRKMHMLKNRQLLNKDPALYLEKKAGVVADIEPKLKSKYEATMSALENSGLPENARHAEARKAVENLYREEIKIADETYPEDFIGKGVEIIKSQKAKLPSGGTERVPAGGRKRRSTASKKKATTPKRKPGRPRKK